MRSRVCRLAGCDNPVSARKRYCSYECRAEAQRQSERRYEDMHREERNEARREARAQDGPRNVERDNEDIIDYCAPGAASRAPSFSGAPEKPAPRRVRQEDGLPDGRVLSPALRAQQLDLSRVPGAVRRDRVRAARLAHDLAQAEQGATGVVSWDSSLQDLQQAVANGARVVDFSNSAIDGSVLRRRPQYAISDPASAGTLYPGRPDDYSQAALGRGVRRAAPPKNSGPRTPTIIN